MKFISPISFIWCIYGFTLPGIDSNLLFFKEIIHFQRGRQSIPAALLKDSPLKIMLNLYYLKKKCKLIQQTRRLNCLKTVSRSSLELSNSSVAKCWRFLLRKNVHCDVSYQDNRKIAENVSIFSEAMIASYLLKWKAFEGTGRFENEIQLKYVIATIDDDIERRENLLKRPHEGDVCMMRIAEDIELLLLQWKRLDVI